MSAENSPGNYYRPLPSVDGKPSRLIYQDEEILEVMDTHYPGVTARTAIAAYRVIHHLHSKHESTYQETPPKDITDEWKGIIDEIAADTMTAEFSKLPIRTHSVGSEGAKEIQYAGVAAASVKGEHGRGNLIMQAVTDVVEGTTPASQKKPGASSVAAVVLKPRNKEYGIKPTPDNVHYLVKLFGPPQGNGVMDMSLTHEENLNRLISVLGIKPYELTQVTMDPNKKGREINWQYIEAAKRVGVKIELINVGDFMPGVKAAMDPEKYGHSPMILVGRGGMEEGVMAAAAARALGGFAQAKEYSADERKLAENPVLTLADHLVPADPKHTIVSATFITPDEKWFKKSGIRNNEGGTFTTTTMVVTHKGVQFREHTILK